MPEVREIAVSDDYPSFVSDLRALVPPKGQPPTEVGKIRMPNGEVWNIAEESHPAAQAALARERNRSRQS